MSQLHTVKMTRKHIVCGYDDRGRRISETLTDIPQVYHDLPYSTALAYKNQFPDANVVITTQEGEVRAWKEAPLPGHRASRRHQDNVEEAIAADDHVAATKTDRLVAAATSGSLGEAL